MASHSPIASASKQSDFFGMLPAERVYSSFKRSQITEIIYKFKIQMHLLCKTSIRLKDELSAKPPNILYKLYLGWILGVDEGAAGVGAVEVPVGGRVERLRCLTLRWVAHLEDNYLASVSVIDDVHAHHIVRHRRVDDVTRK